MLRPALGLVRTKEPSGSERFLAGHAFIETQVFFLIEIERSRGLSPRRPLLQMQAKQMLVWGKKTEADWNPVKEKVEQHLPDMFSNGFS